MTEDDSDENYQITLAQQIFGKAHLYRRNPPEPKKNDAFEAQVPPDVTRDSPVSEISPPAPADSEADGAVQKQFKTADELAEMIELDLARHPDCPKVGFRVTVYGGSHWRAMLTITPAAGGVRNPQEWRDLTDDLASRLRKRYDLAWE